MEFFTLRPDSSWTGSLLFKRQSIFSSETEGRSDSFAGTRTTMKVPGLLLVVLAWVAFRHVSKQADAQDSLEPEA